MTSSIQTVQELLRNAAQRFRDAGIDTPVLDAEVLLSAASNRSRTLLATHPEFAPNPDIADRFEQWVERREHREPLPYIIGEREFYGLTFEVTPAVLIPRQETEILVESALGLIRHICSPVVADIGLGSGAIAVSIAKNAPTSVVYGTETSQAALEVARRNAERLGVADQVRFYSGDLFAPLTSTSFDLIVSNPPYIRSEDIPTLEAEVAKYEPHSALDGGIDGLKYYRRLAEESPAFLKPSGVLAVEVGIGEYGDVEDILRDNDFIHVRSVKDYSGIERVVLGEKVAD